MPPGGQVTPGPEEGDRRGRRSVFMYQADGEGITSILRHLLMCYNKGQVCQKKRLHVYGSQLDYFPFLWICLNSISLVYINIYTLCTHVI